MYNIDELIEKGNEQYKKTTEENSRFKSWEYCYKAFNDVHKSKKKDKETIDYLCLQLAFYLASWGMYRGSSFLLQKDYRIHKPIVEELLDSNYNDLWELEIGDYDNKILIKINKISEKIREYYNKVRKNVKEKNIKNYISNTLITKILLGTMGCVPAYDEYFTYAIRNNRISTGSYNQESLKRIINFYKENIDKLETIRKKMKVNGMNYPPMKLIDSIFWKYGYDNKPKKQK